MSLRARLERLERMAAEAERRRRTSPVEIRRLAVDHLVRMDLNMTTAGKEDRREIGKMFRNRAAAVGVELDPDATAARAAELEAARRRGEFQPTPPD